ncbi:MAG: RAMP superfamily CRISPR-associated protein, partial [Sulfolobus sp.]
MKVLPVVLETLSLTRVGATGVYFDYSAADLVTYKIPLQVNDENYYIPAISATSFKGLLRSTYERYLRKGRVDTKVLENVGVLSEEEKKIVFESLKEELSNYIYAGLIDKVGETLEEAFKQYLEITGYGIDKACYVTSDLDRCENMALIEDEKRRKLKEAWIKLTGRKNLCEVCRVLGTSGVRGFVKFTDLVAEILFRCS